MADDLRSLIEGADHNETPTSTNEETKTGKIEKPESTVPPKDKTDKGEGEEGGEDKSIGDNVDDVVEDDDDDDDIDLDDDIDIDIDEDEDETTGATKIAARESKKFTEFKKETGVKELLKKYPDIEDNYYDARRFKQTFATPEVAVVAAKKAETFDDIVSNLFNGDIGYLLDQLHSIDPRVVPVLVNNFLPTVHERSKEMFSGIVTPIITNALARVARDAQKAGDEELLLAVRYLNRHINGDSGVPGFTKIESLRRRSEDAERVAEEGKQNAETLFYSTIEEQFMPQLEAEIQKGLDPDNALTEEMRNTVVEKVKSVIVNHLGKDQEHMQTMTALKKAARAKNYPKEMRVKIARISLNAARELVPRVRAKVKKAMFGNMFEKKQESTDTSTNGNISNFPGGGGGGSVKLNFDPNKIDWRSTSLRDALDADPSKMTFKK